MLVEFVLIVSTLYQFVSFWSIIKERVFSSYQRESRPSVARSKGEIPTESRMKVASRSPDDWS